MHCRPNGIGTQAHKQFEYLLVCLCAYHARLPRRECSPTPWLCCPVLVVKKDAPVFHRRRLKGMIVGRQCQSIAFLRHLVCPPFPRRHTCKTRQFENAIGSTSAIAACHNQLPVINPDAEGIFLLQQLICIYTCKPQFTNCTFILVYLYYANFCL